MISEGIIAEVTGDKKETTFKFVPATEYKITHDKEDYVAFFDSKGSSKSMRRSTKHQLWKLRRLLTSSC